jgi:hypothetical protein
MTTAALGSRILPDSASGGRATTVLRRETPPT